MSEKNEYVTLLLEGGHEVYGHVTPKQLSAIYEALSLNPEHVRGVIRLDEGSKAPGAPAGEIAVPLRSIIAVRTYRQREYSLYLSEVKRDLQGMDIKFVPAFLSEHGFRFEQAISHEEDGGSYYGSTWVRGDESVSFVFSGGIAKVL